MNNALLLPRRRSGDWVASLLSHSPLALYAADRGLYSDAGTTPAVADDPVYQWNDQSGNARHLSATVLTNRPTLKANIQNGKPAVQFDGIDDYMLASAFQAYPSKRGLVVAVFQDVMNGSNGAVVGSNPAGATPFICFESTTAPAAGITYFDGVALLNAAAADVRLQTHVKAWWRDGDTTLKHRRDAAASDSFTIANNQPSSAVVSVGAYTDASAGFFTGYLMALALFGDKTLAQVQAIESTLDSAWGV